MKIKASSLYTAYNNCLDTLKKRKTKFRQVERATYSEHLTTWSALDDTPQRNGKLIESLHIARYTKGFFFKSKLPLVKFTLSGLPTQEKAYKALLSAEMQAELSESGVVGPAHFINNGLWLERDQCAKYPLLPLSFIDTICQVQDIGNVIK